MAIGVSRVSFGTQQSDFQRLIESEGKYAQKPAAEATQPAAVNEKPAKKGGFGKFLLKTAALVVVAGLALFGLKRGNVLKVDPEAKGIHKLLSKLGEAGEWIGTKAIDPLLNLFKGKKAAEAAEAVEAAAVNVSA